MRELADDVQHALAALHAEELLQGDHRGLQGQNSVCPMGLHVDPEEAPAGEIFQGEVAEMGIGRGRCPELKPAPLITHTLTLARKKG